jgi:hypothetical protein
MDDRVTLRPILGPFPGYAPRCGAFGSSLLAGLHPLQRLGCRSIKLHTLCNALNEARAAG